MIDINTYDYDIIKLTLLNPKKVKDELMKKLEDEKDPFYNEGCEENSEEAEKKKKAYADIETKLQELEFINV